MIHELAGGNLDIDLISQNEVPWQQAACPWNEEEGCLDHRCAVKTISICKYFCGIKHLDTVLCCYPDDPGTLSRDPVTGALTYSSGTVL